MYPSSGPPIPDRGAGCCPSSPRPGLPVPDTRQGSRVLPLQLFLLSDSTRFTKIGVKLMIFESVLFQCQLNQKIFQCNCNVENLKTSTFQPSGARGRGPCQIFLNFQLCNKAESSQFAIIYLQLYTLYL